MQHVNLNNEEQDILAEYEQGAFRPSQQDKGVYQKYAQASLNKTRNINIRLTEADLQRIKAKAAQRGIPYQTLVSSVIHQYVNENTKQATLIE